MNQILRCDRLPERARWSYLARSGLPAGFREKNFPESHIINPLLTKFVRSRPRSFFCEFTDLDSVSVHKAIPFFFVLRPSPLFFRLLSNAFSDFGSVGRKKEKKPQN